MKNVVIIGAGPAGLTAAVELLKDGGSIYNVTILEESSDIGGISKTVSFKGNRMDLGGHRFFTKVDEVNKFWNDIMPLQGADSYDDKKLGRKKPLSEGGPDPEKTDRVCLVRDRVSRIYYRKHFFDYPISMKLDTIKNLGFFTTAKAGCSYLKTCVVKKPEDNRENFYINRFGKVLYGMFFESYTEKLWGRHPREISADWGAQRVKGLSIMAVLKDMTRKLFGTKGKGEVETSLIEQFWYPKLGPGQMWEETAAKAVSLGAKLYKNHKVTGIGVKDGRAVSVTCETPSGEKTFDADIILSSMPLKELVLAVNGTQVPEDVMETAKGLPYRDFITMGLLVDKLKLKNTTKIKTLGDIVPDNWIYVQDKGVKLGRIQIFNNWSPYMVADPDNTVWIGLEYFCNEGDDFWNMTDRESAKLAVKELRGMGVIDKGAVKAFHREKVKKAYPAYFDTYKDIDRVIDYVDGLQNIYCIGRNGQHRYNNMDHSMLTAMKAAQAIKSGRTDKTAIWNVNTEKEYHESK